MTRPATPKPDRPRKPNIANAKPVGVGREPSDDSAQALVQLKRSFGPSWTENTENPSVKLLACETMLGTRVNSYADGRWITRRITEDTLVALVEMQDGTQQKVQFHRGVLDATWQRVAS